MNESPVKIRDLIIFSFFSLIIIGIVFLYSFFDDRTKIVFCDVGQGDAAYIRIRNMIDILIDAGPNRKVLNCLGKHMPFWDRKIEMIFISHNQKDHFGGVDYVLDRYQVGTMYLVNDINRGLVYNTLIKKINNKKIKIKEEITGKSIIFMNNKLSILWPPKGLVSNNDNDFSSVILFDAPTIKILFTGDASPFVLNSIVENGHDHSLQKINILKIPHHGSKNGLNKNFLGLADPSLAVISVGKNNSYGHPSKEVLNMLKAKNVKVRRTDKDGDIVFKIQSSKVK